MTKRQNRHPLITDIRFHPRIMRSTSRGTFLGYADLTVTHKGMLPDGSDMVIHVERMHVYVMSDKHERQVDFPCQRLLLSDRFKYTHPYKGMVRDRQAICDAVYADPLVDNTLSTALPLYY